MGYLSIDSYDRISMSDSDLGAFASKLEAASESGTGFFLDLPMRRFGVVEKKDRRTETVLSEDVDAGHQRIWVHPIHSIMLVFDGPSPSDPRVGG
ncbi:hypothetical protein [Aeromicrobium sp. CTD01-1L150]|uniref:hypothetical protein n=1 Tax=Aeromicrobium sp. CTD01-1L150 TaxID=3341830 RepID=UPI0035BEC46B